MKKYVLEVKQDFSQEDFVNMIQGNTIIKVVSCTEFITKDDKKDILGDLTILNKKVKADVNSAYRLLLEASKEQDRAHQIIRDLEKEL